MRGLAKFASVSSSLLSALYTTHLKQNTLELRWLMSLIAHCSCINFRKCWNYLVFLLIKLCAPVDQILTIVGLHCPIFVFLWPLGHGANVGISLNNPRIPRAIVDVSGGALKFITHSRPHSPSCKIFPLLPKQEL